MSSTVGMVRKPFTFSEMQLSLCGTETHVCLDPEVKAEDFSLVRHGSLGAEASAGRGLAWVLSPALQKPDIVAKLGILAPGKWRQEK